MATPTLITVTGKHTKRDGVTPETGTVVFQAPGFVRSSADKLVISPGKTTAVLDENGAYSVALFACNDPVWNSINWSYTVIVSLSQHRETFTFSIPYDQPGSTIDMSQMAPEPPEGGTNYSLVNHTHLGGGGGGGSTAWTDITGKPTTFTPSTHSHAQSDITGLAASLALKADATALTSGLAAKANTSHTHAQSDVTGLTTALGLKADASAVTTALGAKADLVGGVVPTSQIPALAINDTFTVASQAAMLALTAQRGDMAVRSDTTPATVYVLAVDDPTTLANWIKVSFGAIQTVNGQTGVVVLSATDVGLGNVSNTSDATKNSATATLTNKTLTSPAISSPTFSGTPTGLTAAHVGLGNVTNTSDSTKPVSGPQQTALDAKPDVYAWSGSAYVLVTTGDIYIGPAANDPGAVGNGSVWIKTS